MGVSAAVTDEITQLQCQYGSWHLSRMRIGAIRANHLIAKLVRMGWTLQRATIALFFCTHLNSRSAVAKLTISSGKLTPSRYLHLANIDAIEYIINNLKQSEPVGFEADNNRLEPIICIPCIVVDLQNATGCDIQTAN